MKTIHSVAECTMKAFDWRQFLPTGAWSWSQKNGVSAGAAIGDTHVKVEISLSIPVEQMSAAILPLMTVLFMANQVARIDDGAPALPIDQAVQYVAKVWFPEAAADYVHDHAEDFIDAGEGPSLCEDSLFEKVMAKLFWPAVSIDMPDPEGFDKAVYEAIDQKVFDGAREQLKDIAADWRAAGRSSYGNTGMCQRDFR